MAQRDVRITLRDRQITGGSIPGDALFGEPFINVFDGILKFSGITGGSYEQSNQTGISEAGSKLYNQKITNRLSINDSFIISGDSGIISTYNGQTGGSLVGKFLSGTTSGFTLANVSDIMSASAGINGDVQFNNGANGFGAENSFNYNNSTDTLRVNNLSATTLSGLTIISGSTDINLFFNQDRAQINTKANLSGATFTGTISAPNITDTALTSGWAVYAGIGGVLQTNSGFTFDDSASSVFAQNMQIGSPSLSGTMTVWGNILIMGEAVSAFTSQLYVEDNNIILNYNPSASTISTSLGAGLTVQDGSGVSGTPVFFDIRGTATTVDNRSFSTNLGDLRIRETGTASAPNGVRVIAEFDILDAGQF